MAGLSDLVLDLKIIREACHLNLAPTTSTTAALAVGDAIAITLMKMKGLSEHDFARLHPGGQLGKRLLLTVEDVMRKGPDNPVIQATQSIKEMLARITSFRVGAISIVDERGELVGLVGQTGLATGPHLHFMMVKNGTPINPVPALKKGEPAPPIEGKLKAEFVKWVKPVESKLDGRQEYVKLLGPIEE